ncbi:hypothetical protein IW261DRAFT_1598552 [Armillaria novae-zelandiae]|uniref:Uncharacterized protein n=1 Tax=Armillaria novae-zelandiae TaxID=153914 RepID=A0AA39NHH3_9AGAR|nr:hypothetical protein IW261DRAFT_1598552 [Armillaria novae-zelandiae]
MDASKKKETKRRTRWKEGCVGLAIHTPQQKLRVNQRRCLAVKSQCNNKPIIDEVTIVQRWPNNADLYVFDHHGHLQDLLLPSPCPTRRSRQRTNKSLALKDNFSYGVSRPGLDTTLVLLPTRLASQIMIVKTYCYLSRYHILRESLEEPSCFSRSQFAVLISCACFLEQGRRKPYLRSPASNCLTVYDVVQRGIGSISN